MPITLAKLGFIDSFLSYARHLWYHYCCIPSHSILPLLDSDTCELSLMIKHHEKYLTSTKLNYLNCP